MARNISKLGEEKIVQWEGEVLHAYDDFDPKHRIIEPGMTVRGTLTAGVGHTGPDVKPGMRITTAQSRAWLRADIDRFEAAVERLVKVPLSDNQFAALVSFAFNVGDANFARSTLLKKLNRGDYEAVPAELMKWVNSKGKRMQGLVNRRAQEGALWGKGELVASGSVDANPDNPWTKPETIIQAAPAAAGLSFLFTGSGPIQLAVAIALVIASIVGAYFIIKRIRGA